MKPETFKQANEIRKDIAAMPEGDEADRVDMIKTIEAKNDAAQSVGIETNLGTPQPQPGKEAGQIYLDKLATSDKIDDLRKTEERKALGKIAGAAAVVLSAAGLTASALSGGSEAPAPNPTAPTEDVATTPDGSTVDIVDAQYADFPSDARKAEVIIGGDTNNDGYIDDTNPSMSGNQATIEK